VKKSPEVIFSPTESRARTCAGKCVLARLGEGYVIPIQNGLDRFAIRSNRQFSSPLEGGGREEIARGDFSPTESRARTCAGKCVLARQGEGYV